MRISGWSVFASLLLLQGAVGCATVIKQNDDDGSGGKAHCDAAPACKDGDQQVDSCPANASCYAESICGDTITCEASEQCFGGPICPPGAQEVDFCGDAPNCSPVSACGTTIYCIGQCTDYPTCDTGDEEVTACPDGGTCYQRFGCGASVTCVTAATCTAFPSCDPGDKEAGSATCPTDVSCYTASLCGNTIACLDDDTPSHDCPQTEPTNGADCASYGMITCSYDQGSGCYGEYHCEGGADESLTWHYDQECLGD